MRCKLCRRQLPERTGGDRCDCGWVLDEGCRSAHAGWCPADRREGWVGVQEF